MAGKAVHGHFMGQEKEPMPHRKSGGPRPVVHSHSAKPKRKITPGKRGRR